jgi:hypothetical protein
LAYKTIFLTPLHKLKSIRIMSAASEAQEPDCSASANALRVPRVGVRKVVDGERPLPRRYINIGAQGLAGLGSVRPARVTGMVPE